MMNKSIEMIELVSEAIKQLDLPVVFVGGATVSLYLNLDTADEVRPTEDVDVIIELVSTLEYIRLSEKLLKQKFNPDTSKGAPICRWKYLGVKIDIMPTNEKILGFSNKYYDEAFRVKEEVLLPNGESIFILPLIYFLATKLEAFRNRGQEDPRFSKDLEDIISILKDPKDLSEINRFIDLKRSIFTEIEKLFSKGSTAEAIRAFTSSDEEFEGIKLKVLNNCL